MTASRAVMSNPNLSMTLDWTIHFYNQRGTAVQHIREGKPAIC